MRLILGCLVLFTACGGDGGVDPTLDAPTSSDAPAFSAMTVTWNASPGVPGQVRTGVNVTSLILRIASLEVIGDAGSGTTTCVHPRVVWNASEQPSDIVFEGALPGLYSKVSLHVDGDVVEPSYEITGTTLIGSTLEPFRITDTAGLEVDIDDYNVSLSPGGAARIPIRIDLRNALDLDWSALDINSGVRTLNQGDGLVIATFRSKLKNGFDRRDD